MKRRVLYLPVEVKPRELYGKLLLAAKAAERGWQVRIGRDREIRKALLGGPIGLFIEVNIPEGKAEELARNKARGHRIVNLCEESIVYHSGRDYCLRKIGPTSLRHVDLLLVVGDRNAGDLHRFRPEAAEKIVITGNPRFDTLMPELRSCFAREARPIRERHGRFLLVNTNFGPVNHVKMTSAEILARLERNDAILDAEHASELQRWHAYKRAHLNGLKPMLAEVARSGRFDKIIVRPHPTENHETWHKWADPLGVEVRFEGSANIWMLAATAYLHTGCTTAIEGALLDLPVTSFVSEPTSDLLNQADEVSLNVGTAEAFLADADAAALAARTRDQRAKVAPIVANVGLPLAVDRILDAVDQLDVAEAPAGPAARGSLFSALGHTLHAAFRRRGSYGYRKFSSLDEDEMRTPLACWVEGGILRDIPDLARQTDGTWIVS